MVVEHDTIIPSAEEAVCIIDMEWEKFGLNYPMDYDAILTISIFNDAVAKKYGKLMAGLIGVDTFSKAALNNYFVDNDYTIGLERTSKGALSFSKESIESFLDTDAYTGKPIELAKYFKKYQKASTIRSSLNSILNSARVSDLRTNRGTRCICVRPKMVPQNTGRLGIKEPAMQNYEKYTAKAIKAVPKGWIRMEVDSSQIEPTIIYNKYINDPQIQSLIELYQDAYYGLIHYATMPQEDLITGRLDFEPMEITKELEERRSTFKTYANAVAYGSTSNPTNDTVKAKLIERVGNHPQRKKWQEEVENKIFSKDYIFYTHFGTPIDVRNNNKRKDEYSDDSGWVHHLIKSAINNPVQGTAADLHRLALKRTREFIVRNTKFSWLLESKHDSIVVAVHESEYSIMKEWMLQAVSYELPGWTKIKSEYEEEIGYSVPDRPVG